MLNDGSNMRISYLGATSKKGLADFNKFQGRIKNLSNNLDFDIPEIKESTIWEKLRNKA